MNQVREQNSEGLLLAGLDGGNPLAFLAALGTLRILSLAKPEWNMRMAWRAAGAWRPVLQADSRLEKEAVLPVLYNALKQMMGHPAFAVADDLKISGDDYRCYTQQAAQSAHETKGRDRCWADFAAAFGCETIQEDDLIQDTALRTMSGAGHQHFLTFMCELIQKTGRDHLETALFQTWSYEDSGPSLRWDPQDDRRYALRWNEPSGDPIRTVRGANRLAIEGLPLLPTIPVRTRLHTTGFSGSGSRDTFWTWPIWTVPISVEVVSSLQALEALQEPQPSREKLAAMGVMEIYRSQRLTVGKYRNFTMGRSVEQTKNN